MGQSILNIRPEIGSGDDRTPVASGQRVDLSTRRGRRYIFPEPINEFDDDETVTLTLKTDGSPLRVSKFEEKARLRRDGEMQTRYERGLSGKARQGVVKDRITVNTGGLSYRVVILFPLAGDDLNQKQYDLMLEDISHWLHASLHRKTEHETEPEGRNAADESLKADIETFYRVRRHVKKLDTALKRISRSPEEEIKNTYKQTRGDSPRQDARTIRWNEARSGLPESLTYEPTQTFDVYENRFILFLLHRLDQLLQTVEKSSAKTEQKLEDKLQKLKRNNRSSRQINEAKKDYARIVDIIDMTSNLRGRVQKIRRYPFLRNVKYNPSQFKVSSTLTLTQNFNYSKVFSIYKKLRQDKRLRRLSNISQFVEGISTIGVRKTSQVYEYWTFFAVYKTLIKIGFEEDSESDIIGMIDQESLTPGLVPGRYVRLYFSGRSDEGREGVYPKNIMIRLNYEKSFYVGENREIEKAKPDITLEVFNNCDRLVGRFLMDAKYQTRDSPVGAGFKGGRTSKNGITQAEKYQNKRLKNGRIEKGMGAFFLHVDVDEKDFDLTRCVNGDKRWHGHFAVLPDDIGRLETLLEELFLQHRIPQALN